MATVAAPRYRPIGKLNHDHSAAWRHLDLVLLATVAAISALGLLMVYSATRGVEQPYDTSYVTKQFMFLVLGVTAMAVVAMVDYRKIRDLAPFIYGASILLLVLVRSPLGSRQNGTQGWFQIGPFQLQPSEFAKLGLIIGFAWLASQFRGEIDGRRFVALLAVGALPDGARHAAARPRHHARVGRHHASCSSCWPGHGPRQLVAARASAPRSSSARCCSRACSAPRSRTGSPRSSTRTRRRRSTSPTRRSAEYNLRQSKIAIGSGGWTGKGVFNGTQTRLNNVPFQHTDFIFTAVGEQLGLVGAGVAARPRSRSWSGGSCAPRSSPATTSGCSSAPASWPCSCSRSSRTSA